MNNESPRPRDLRRPRARRGLGAGLPSTGTTLAPDLAGHPTAVARAQPLTPAGEEGTVCLPSLPSSQPPTACRAAKQSGWVCGLRPHQGHSALLTTGRHRWANRSVKTSALRLQRRADTLRGGARSAGEAGGSVGDADQAAPAPALHRLRPANPRQPRLGLQVPVRVRLEPRHRHPARDAVQPARSTPTSASRASPDRCRAPPRRAAAADVSHRSPAGAQDARRKSRCVGAEPGRRAPQSRLANSLPAAREVVAAARPRRATLGPRADSRQSLLTSSLCAV